jgi:TadE-like protein
MNGSETKRTAPRRFNFVRRGRRSEEGSSLVEMALVSAFIFLPMLFGIIEVSYGVYVYGYVCESSRLATRYASVRGAESCTIAPSFTDCNLGPGGSTNSSPGSGSTPLQNYVQNLGYPGIDTSKLTVTSTWYTENITNPTAGAYSTVDWNTSCTSGTCNNKGYAVRVVVSYPFPLNIPFWKNATINLSSTSQMMINE